MITADVSCRLLEVDFAGIENTLVGWFIWRHGIDQQSGYDYIRWSRLGLHAAVTALKVGKPALSTWADEQIVDHLGKIKHDHPVEYDLCKRVDHGTGYGLTPYGMCEMFPDYFKTPKDAQHTQNFLFTLAPGLSPWHTALRKQARATGFLGGATAPDAATPGRWDHPFGYRHWFWDVLSYKPTDEVTARKWLRDPRTKDRIVIMHGRYFKIDWGGDSKRVIAFYPQSTGAGVLKRAEMLLFGDPDSPDYIGDCYFGRTPLLGPIHDALLLHVPNLIYDRVLETVVRVMQAEIPQLPCPPEWNIGPFLRIGVEAKGGAAWDKKSMHKLKTPPLVMNVPHPEDAPVVPREDGDGEDWDALRRVVG